MQEGSISEMTYTYTPSRREMLKDLKSSYINLVFQPQNWFQSILVNKKEYGMMLQINDSLFVCNIFKVPNQILGTTFTVFGSGLLCVYYNADSVGLLR
jgi:hypothetical protein